MSRERLRQHPGFVAFWTASTVSDLGSALTGLALQTLVLVTLGGSNAELGLVSSGRWVAYAAVGLVAGIFLDRVRRRPVLIATDLAQGVLLGSVAVLGWFGLLRIWSLIGLMIVFGLAALFNDAAYQAITPQLVPRRLLTRANTRLQQSTAVAQTSGPALAGVVIRIVGAPLAIAVDALSFLLSAAVMTRLPTDPHPSTAAPAEPTPPRAEPVEAPAQPTPPRAEPVEAPAEPVEAPAEPVEAPAEPTPPRAEPVEAPAQPTPPRAEPVEAHPRASFRAEIIEGLRWIYGHRFLGPLTINTHLWFVCYSALNTIMISYAYRRLGLGVLTVGVCLALGSAASLVTTTLSERMSERWGTGRTILVSRCGYLPGVLALLLAASRPPASVGTVVWFAAAQLIIGLVFGLEGPAEITFRQAVTPNRLQGRTNATGRSVNRTMIVLSAPLAGLLADRAGFRVTLIAISAGFALVAAVYALSPMRRAVLPADDG